MEKKKLILTNREIDYSLSKIHDNISTIFGRGDQLPSSSKFTDLYFKINELIIRKSIDFKSPEVIKEISKINYNYDDLNKLVDYLKTFEDKDVTIDLSYFNNLNNYLKDKNLLKANLNNIINDLTMHNCFVIQKTLIYLEYMISNIDKLSNISKLVDIILFDLNYIS